MYICCGCGREFDEPVRFADREEYWGVPCEREYWLSPCCREAFDEVTDNDESEESEDEE